MALSILWEKQECPEHAIEAWVLPEPMELEPQAVGLLNLGLFSRGYVGVTWF